ncbi:MAG: SufD family Fe-S cluster assembly protein [Oscillospiraceae bacterium]|nr:SufD family Fe-S cluster assembly protein [Oscillospiraceae bacterium]
MATVQLNQLPVPTFSWLGVNGTERELYNGPADEIAVSGAEKPVTRIHIAKSANISVSGSKKPQLIVMNADAEQAVIRTDVHAESSEQIRLVQIIRGGKNVLELHAELAENASLELIQIYLNPADCVSGAEIHMNGRKSAFTSNIGYALADGNALDLNLNIVQRGKKTVSDTTVRGVLRGQAKKIFRGSIDFQNGAAGASGTEQENVLLLDETVINKTVPVILCAEEDVVGSHGATIGKIDPAHIFYMQSRGIPEAQIYEILAQSQLGSIVRQIGDAETEQAVSRLLGRESADE